MIPHSRRMNKKVDARSVLGNELVLSAWAEVIVCKKDYGKLWIVVEEDALAGWTTNSKV